MNVGAQLRQAREARHLSIDDLARATRINARAIAAIEAGKYEQLPGGLYARGMLRACAREVGLDPEITVGAFRTEVGQQPGAPATQPPASGPNEARALLSTFAAAAAGVVGAVDSTWYIAAVALLAMWLAYGTTGSDAQPSSPPAIASESSPTSTIGRAGDDRPTGTSGNVDVNAAATDGLDIEIRATDRCWVAAVADNRRVVYRLMQSGEIERLRARDLVSLRVGNPAALELTVNGQKGRSLGNGDRPVTVRVTPQTYRDFILP